MSLLPPTGPDCLLNLENLYKKAQRAAVSFKPVRRLSEITISV